MYTCTVTTQPHRCITNNPSLEFAQLLMVKLPNAKITGGCSTQSPIVTPSQHSCDSMILFLELTYPFL